MGMSQLNDRLQSRRALWIYLFLFLTDGQAYHNPTKASVFSLTASLAFSPQGTSAWRGLAELLHKEGLLLILLSLLCLY